MLRLWLIHLLVKLLSVRLGLISCSGKVREGVLERGLMTVVDF